MTKVCSAILRKTVLLRLRSSCQMCKYLIVRRKSLYNDSESEPCYHEKISGKMAHHMMYVATFHEIE